MTTFREIVEEDKELLDSVKASDLGNKFRYIAKIVRALADEMDRRYTEIAPHDTTSHMDIVNILRERAKEGMAFDEDLDRAADEIERLRRGIREYLDGNQEGRPEAHFLALLNPKED